MPTTFTKIAAVTVGSGGASTIDFTSIPSTYTDLCLKVSARGDLTQVYDSLYFQLNGLTTSIYTRLTISASGSGTPGSGSSTSTQMFFGAAAGNSATANTFGSSELYFPNYAGSANKSTSSESVQETNATTAYMYVHAGLTATTAAITSIKLLIESNKFLQYSTATLYGIKNS
jgi:hypothetical protein